MTQTWLQKCFAPLKRGLPQSMWQPLRAVATGVVTPIRFSTVSGHWKSSLAMAAKSPDGSPLPWYTYPMIDFLSQRSFDGKRVLELGGGQSTLWWSSRAKSVMTLEDDADWYSSLRSKVAPNVDLHHVDLDPIGKPMEQIAGLLQGSGVGKFDVIVVDGLLRRELTALSFDYLAPDGAIILDNAEGYGFYEELKDRNCRRIDFFGFAPGVSLRHCTSLVFVGDCFLLQPDVPIPVIELPR